MSRLRLTKMTLLLRSLILVVVIVELAGIINVTNANLSILKTGKARAIRFSTPSAICRALGFRASRPPGPEDRFIVGSRRKAVWPEVMSPLPLSG